MENFENHFSSISSLSPSLSCSSLPKEHHLCPRSECWLIAEQAALEILSVVKPTVVSEQRRWEVIMYIQNLIRGYVVGEVLPFGSVPLKTYLPHGDIDLTALTAQTDEECLARTVCSVLEVEGQKYGGLIQDVQFVNAQVKVVKCIVQHISVDISFNRAAGLGSLCFLEQIDRLIGRDHLFKRSIILIKAWCFYESRLLGGHCGLMSTYALETMVLYIINLFHSSLHGPFTVFYKFLDYYSNFDWVKYCISVNGPVIINSLPEIVVETSDTSGNSLLLSKEFLQSCQEYFSVPMRGFEIEPLQFNRKHFNIMDPLKWHNNLGRSITKGNSRRIKSAFCYGCQKLREILMLPAESICDALKSFFLNTYQRNGMEQRLDPEVSAMNFDPRTSDVFGLNGDYDGQIWCLNYAQSYLNSTLANTLPDSPTLPSLFQNQSIDEQKSLNVLYPASANCFIPSSFCYPDASQLFQSAFGVDEMAIQGRSILEPQASSEEKFKLKASAPPFWGRTDEKKLNSQVIDSSIPKTSMEREAKPQGTDICLLNENFSDRHTNLLQIGGNSGGLPLKSSFETQLVDDSCQPEKDGGSNSFVLSLEDFPLLPSKKEAISPDKDFGSSCIDLSVEDFHLLLDSKNSAPSEDHESGQQTKESPPVSELSARAEGDSATCASSPALSVISSPGALKQTDDGLDSLEPKIGFLNVAYEKMQDPIEGDKELSVVQPLLLDDEKEFPPLQR